jgi:hypothetical protein
MPGSQFGDRNGDVRAMMPLKGRDGTNPGPYARGAGPGCHFGRINDVFSSIMCDYALAFGIRE